MVGDPPGDPGRDRPAGRQLLFRRSALMGRRVELRYDPEDLAVIEVFLDGKPAGAAVPFVIGRHVHRAVAPAAPPGRTRPGSTTSAWSPPPTTSKPAPARRSTSPSCLRPARRRTEEDGDG